MAASDSCTNINKRILDNTFMYTYYIKSGLQTTLISFKVLFKKFLMIKDNIDYAKTLSYNDWRLHILKKRKAVILTLCASSDCTYDVKCCVRYDHNSLSRFVPASKVSTDEYLIELSSEIIHDPQNEILKDGCLFCEIQFDPKSDIRSMCPVTESRIMRKDNLVSLYSNDIPVDTEEEGLMKDIKELFYGHFSDFKINLEGSVANVNKSVLAVRSKFFFDYLKENPDAEEMDIDTSLDALSIMLQYMYYGAFFDQTLGIMLGVIRLAKKLQMKRLQELCTRSVKKLIDSSNVHLIRDLGLIIGANELVSVADEFLSCM